MNKLLLLLLLPFLLLGNITLDGSPGTPGASGCGATSNCPTWSQTFASNATHAIVRVNYYAAVGAGVSAVTIGGVLTCSSVKANDGTHNATAEILVCPLSFTGTQTVAVTLNTTPAGGWGVSVQSIIGAPSSSFIDGTAATTVVAGTSNTMTTSVTTSTAGSWCFSAAALTTTATGISFGAGETQSGSTITGSGYIGVSANKPDLSAGANTQTTNWGNISSGFVAQAQTCVKPISFGTSLRRRTDVRGE